MAKWVIAYISAAIAFGVLDSIWLNWAGSNLYEPAIGEIMAESFRVAPAAAFYVIYIAGIVWFAVRPGIDSAKPSVAALNGMLLGALCYATFDLTSQAVFKVWATHVTVIDIIWGAFATAIAATFSTWATLKING